MSARTPREALILLSLWLLLFVSASQFLVMVPILSDIGRELDIPESLQGTLVSVYGVVSAMFSLVAGPISDQVGRRRILLYGSAMMAVALALAERFNRRFLKLILVQNRRSAAMLASLSRENNERLTVFVDELLGTIDTTHQKESE